ncbi:MAG: hypothetical protein IJE78_00345 [Bacteroidaceae bacterium]|nr:hypothetical protein [Bacteroidaceae bacterium]
MITETIKLTQVSQNEKNPRKITEGNLKKLINSILVFPKMLELRPIVIDDTMIPLGGNMRIKALTQIAAMDIDEISKRLERMVEGTDNPSNPGKAFDRRRKTAVYPTPTYLDLIREAKNRGADAMSTEFFCVEQRSPTLKEYMPTINELAGFDVMKFYRKYSVSTGYLRLNRKVKEPFFKKMKALCEEIGMRFYVSDAHFKELCCNGSCCGLPDTWNYSRGQWCEALQIAKKSPDKTVTWNDVCKDIEILVSQFQWGRAEGFNCNSSEKRAKFDGMTMADYMRYLWNNPQNGQSPYKLFEGALIPSGKDKNGNLIYKYNGATF